MPSTRRSRSNIAIKEESEEKFEVMRKRKMPESPKKPASKHVMSENDPKSESDSDDSDLENYEIDLVKRREENIRLNHEFFQKFGISQAKQEFLATQSTKSKGVSQRGLKKEKVAAEILPRRSSLRLQNKTPEGIELPPEALINRASYTPYQPEEHLRPPAGPLNMKEILYSTSKVAEHDHIISIVKQMETKPDKQSTYLTSYVSRMQKCKLSERCVAKVVPQRTFSLAIHPTTNKVLVATGDKWGRVGLWDVMCNKKSASDGVCCYAPHSRPVNCLDFRVDTPEKLYSCSYDGSLRCGDLRKEVFDEIYSIDKDYDILLRNFSFTSTHTMLVAQNNGCVAQVDTRTPGCKAEHTYNVHDRALRTVSVHPTMQQYFCTAGIEGILRVWDVRNIQEKKSLHKKYLFEFPHGRSVSSAYFSPVTGKYILATSMDNKLTIFDTSTIDANIKQKKMISHNNHTGRWLTGFRANWHPAREDVFVVGSMNRPREITMYSDQGTKLHSFLDEDYLGSVCSLNVLHPTRDIVVGTNSSGRLHVFM